MRGVKDIIHRTKRGEAVEERVETLLRTTSEMRDKGASSRDRKRIESVAVTDIRPQYLMEMFNLRYEPKPTNYWIVQPCDVRHVSGHLGESDSVVLA